MKQKCKIHIISLEIIKMWRKKKNIFYDNACEPGILYITITLGILSNIAGGGRKPLHKQNKIIYIYNKITLTKTVDYLVRKQQKCRRWWWMKQQRDNDKSNLMIIRYPATPFTVDFDPIFVSDASQRRVARVDHIVEIIDSLQYILTSALTYKLIHILYIYIYM